MKEFVDKNMVVKSTIDKPDVKFYDVKSGIFSVFGLDDFYGDEYYKRIPISVATATSDGVRDLNFNTAGGRIVFKTNSPYVAIYKISNDYFYDGSNMTGIGGCGLDLYVKENGKFVCRGTFRPPVNACDDYQSVVNLAGGDKEVMINMPLYAGFKALYVGVKEGSYIEKCNPYRDILPIVYYGSSITQGGCATRPSNSYQGFISRTYDVDYRNLGYSGCAKAEPAIVEYMSTLKMSLFVLDYDHNADNPEYLRKTHYGVYKTIREKNKDLPIIMVTKPDFYNDDKHENPERLQIITESYNRAVAEGDKNVYFIDGRTLFDGEFSDCCTVDGCHPNDLGFFRMANVIGKKIAEILKF